MTQIIDKNDSKKLPKDVWDKSEGVNTYDVNSYYIPKTNEIVIPNAILKPPFFDIEKNIIYNLANIGTIIGHELMHSIDNTGIEYNENSEYKNWLSDKDILLYNSKIKHFKKIYENTGKIDNIKIDGNLSLGENISDIYGFLLCEELLINILKKDMLKTHEKYETPDQIMNNKIENSMKEFYCLYAKKWKTTEEIIKKKKYLNINVHSNEKYRVNNVLSMSPMFRKIYGIKKGDKMYIENKDHLFW